VKSITRHLSKYPKLKATLHAVGGLLLWSGIFLLTDSLCFFQSFFGIPCPGCGSTRAAVALLRGRFTEAIAFHPLIPLSLALLPYAALRNVLGKHKPVSKAERNVVMCMIALYIVVFVVRMFLLFPHTPPMVPLENALWPNIFGWVRSLVQ